jgi:hypothetical protein
VEIAIPSHALPQPTPAIEMSHPTSALRRQGCFLSVVALQMHELSELGSFALAPGHVTFTFRRRSGPCRAFQLSHLTLCHDTEAVRHPMMPARRKKPVLLYNERLFQM